MSIAELCIRLPTVVRFRPCFLSIVFVSYRVILHRYMLGEEGSDGHLGVFGGGVKGDVMLLVLSSIPFQTDVVIVIMAAELIMSVSGAIKVVLEVFVSMGAVGLSGIGIYAARGEVRVQV